MKIDFESTDLRPLIRAVAAEVLEQLDAERTKLNGHLAFSERQAAELVGIPTHSLRDLRLRGEIHGSRLGRRIVYRRDELMKLLERTEE